jgi:hypothetical protein
LINSFSAQIGVSHFHVAYLDLIKAFFHVGELALVGGEFFFQLML